MRPRARTVTDTDVALLRTIARDRSVVAASRRVGISRDRANYRLARLAQAFGGRVVTGVRGGPGHGGTRLTALGDRIIRGGFDSVELLDARPVARAPPSNRLRGTYRGGALPTVDLGGGVALQVAFSAEEGERVSVILDPEAVLLAPARFASSARNVLRATVGSVSRAVGPSGATVTLHVGPVRLQAAVTEASIRQLRLRRGARTWIYLKATALRRVARAR